MRKTVGEVIIKNGCEYTKSNGRMKYNPEFCENHGRPYTTDDLIYICSVWDTMPKAEIAMAVGKTHGSVLSKKHYLTTNYIDSEKRITLFEHYKKLGDKQYGEEKNNNSNTFNKVS